MIKVGSVFWGRWVTFSYQGDILFIWHHCCSWFGLPGWCSVCKFLHSNVILFFPLSSYTVLSAAHAARVGSYVSLLLRRHLYKNYVKFFCMRDLSVLHLFTYSVIYLYHYELILIILWVTILCYYYFSLILLFDSFFCLLLQSTPVSLDVPPYFVNITRWSWLIWCITVLDIWEFVTIKKKNYCHRHVARALAEQILKHPMEVHWISWLLRNMWPKGDEGFWKNEILIIQISWNCMREMGRQHLKPLVWLQRILYD